MAGNQGLKDESNFDEFFSREENDPLMGFNISDISDDYYGFLRSDGAWYILKFFDNQARYAAGSSGYNFSNRESLEYKEYNDVF